MHLVPDQFLAGLPVIVGGSGDPKEPCQVVTCASYEARRVRGAAGMPFEAGTCETDMSSIGDPAEHHGLYS